MTAVVAIDGPSGSGKSTVARMLAERLKATHVDTGAMYRAFALKAMRSSVVPADSDGISRLLAATTIEINGDQVTTMDGEDVSGLLRTPEVTEQASLFAAISEVREWMVTKQRGIAASSPGITVFEGRDIGSIVFPDAALKVFVTASVEERTKRRAAEMDRPQRDVREEIRTRDQRDTGRSHSPMMVAEGAVVVDTTGLSPRRIVEQLAALVEERLS